MAACQKNIPIPDPTPDPQDDEEDDGIYRGAIPQEIDELPRVYINRHGQGYVGGNNYDNNKRIWTEMCDIEIRVKVNGKDTLVFAQDSMKYRGHGNSTWKHFPKKSYYFKLNHKANLIGSGQTRRWVLLANWMDRTLMRNAVAMEAARRTSLEWTPSGTFVELYVDEKVEPTGYRHLGNYWMCEKIHVEKGNFLCDYLYSMDDSDYPYNVDFETKLGFCPIDGRYGMPVELKYPDSDDYPEAEYNKIIAQAKECLLKEEEKIYSFRDDFYSMINMDSFCDWYIIQELTCNQEANHPKSCFFYSRNGILYAGPVWDFDWGTFTEREPVFLINRAIYFGNVKLPQDGIERSGLLYYPAFRKRLKERWAALKPQFLTLDEYIDKQAEWIRASEEVNHRLWPIFGHGEGDDKDHNGIGIADDKETLMVNYDENLSFQEAVDLMKVHLRQRISDLDVLINAL